MTRGKRELNFAKDGVGSPIDIMTQRCVKMMSEYGEDGYPLRLLHEPVWEQQTQEPICEPAVDYQLFLAYCDLEPQERSIKRWSEFCGEKGLLALGRARNNNKDLSRLRLFRWIERAAVYDIHQRQRKAAEWYRRDEARRDSQYQTGRELVDYGKSVLNLVTSASPEPDMGLAMKTLSTGYLYQADAVPQLQLSVDQMQNTLAMLGPEKRAAVLSYLRAARQSTPINVSHVPELNDDSDIIHNLSTDDVIDAEVSNG